MKYEDFIVQSLGKTNVLSPLKNNHRDDHPVYKYVSDSERILYDPSLEGMNRAKESI